MESSQEGYRRPGAGAESTTPVKSYAAAHQLVSTKLRTMQTIEEVESNARGAYAGGWARPRTVHADAVTSKGAGGSCAAHAARTRCRSASSSRST